MPDTHPPHPETADSYGDNRWTIKHDIKFEPSAPISVQKSHRLLDGETTKLLKKLDRLSVEAARERQTENILPFLNPMTRLLRSNLQFPVNSSAAFHDFVKYPAPAKQILKEIVAQSSLQLKVEIRRGFSEQPNGPAGPPSNRSLIGVVVTATFNPAHPKITSLEKAHLDLRIIAPDHDHLAVQSQITSSTAWSREDRPHLTEITLESDGQALRIPFENPAPDTSGPQEFMDAFVVEGDHPFLIEADVKGTIQVRFGERFEKRNQSAEVTGTWKLDKKISPVESISEDANLLLPNRQV